MVTSDWEESKQGIENLFEEIMTENVPNLVKEKDVQVQKSQSPKQVGRKEAYTKTHHNYSVRVKDKVRILKAAREKQVVT